MTPRLAAARLLVRLERAGVELRWAGPSEIAYRAETGALTDALRAEIAAAKPALVELLEPWNLPIGEHRFTLFAAIEDPEWRQDGLKACAVCSHGSVWTSPEGVPMHPSCDPFFGVL